MTLRSILGHGTFLGVMLAGASLYGQLGLFQSPNPNPDEHFGSQIVPMGTDRVLIGRYLFDLQGSLIRTFQDPAPIPSRTFGASIAAVGPDKVLFGSPADSNVSGNEDVAYLFDINGSLLRTYRNPSSHSTTFGLAVAAVGADKVLIGDPARLEPRAGRAFLFDLQGNLLRTYEEPSTEAEAYGFGSALTGLGTGKVVITRGRSLPAFAYVFDLQGNLLSTVRTPAMFSFLISPVAAVGDDHFLIGLPQSVYDSDLLRMNSGHAFLFDACGQFLTNFQQPTPVADGYFGYAIAAVGSDRVLIGAPDAHGGAAFLFDLSGNPVSSYSDPLGGSFGGSVAAIGSDLLLIQGPGSAVSLFHVQENPQAPVIVCPPDRTFTCRSDVPPAEFAGSVTDVSDPNPQVILRSEFGQGSNLPGRFRIFRIWQATNAHGLSSTCTENILVEPVPGDLNGSCSFDEVDFRFLLEGIRAHTTDPAYDVNGDGKVDIADARYFVVHILNPAVRFK